MTARQKIERLKLVLERLARGDAADERRADRIREDDESQARMARGTS
jgi:hypothetical protein